MARMTGGVIARFGRRAAPVTAAPGHGRAATAGRNGQWDPPPGATGG
jgi:hypothetical protein